MAENGGWGEDILQNIDQLHVNSAHINTKTKISIVLVWFDKNYFTGIFSSSMAAIMWYLYAGPLINVTMNIIYNKCQ